MSHSPVVQGRSRSKLLAGVSAAALAVVMPCVAALAAAVSGHLPEVVEQARPKREADLIAIHEDARRQFADATTIDKRKNVRLSMQIRVQDLLLPDTSMTNWTGVLDDLHRTKDGDIMVKIEIAPNIVITTPPNRIDDPQHLSLVEGGTPLAKMLDRLHAGTPIVFSGRILKILATTDDEMVERPTMSAHFDSIKRIVAVPTDGGQSK